MTLKSYHAALKQQLRELTEEGLNYEQIVEATGLSLDTIRRALRRYRLGSIDRLTPRRVGAITAALQRGFTLEQVAAAYRVPLSPLEKVIHADADDH